jgi:hypothetical protein
MKALPTMLFLAISVTGLRAQSAAPVAPGAAPVAPPEGKIANANPFLDLPGYLAERSAALAIRTRSLDPFGRPKDPSRTPPPDAVPTTPDNNVVNQPKVDPKAVFEEAVAGLKVIMAGESKFTLEGGTTLSRGQTFNLTSPQMRFRVQVMAVTPEMIELRETGKDFRAQISINSMPSGMVRGGSIRMPGKQTRSSDVPEIESSNLTQPSTPGVP